MPASPVPIVFPVGGIVERPAYAEQSGPLVVEADACLNVRPHDALEDRQRGGQRAGLSKYFPDPLAAATPVQELASAVMAFDPATVEAGTLLFEDDFEDYTAGQTLQAENAAWNGRKTGAGGGDMGYVETDGNGPVIEASGGANWLAFNDVGGGLTSGTAAIYETALSLGSVYVIRLAVKFVSTSTGRTATIIFRADKAAYAAQKHFYAQAARTAATTITITLYKQTANETRTLLGTTTVTVANAEIDATFEVRVNGDAISVWWDGIAKLSVTDATYNTQANFGIGMATTVLMNLLIGGIAVYTGVTPASLRTTKIIAVAGGSVYSGTPSIPMSVVSGGATLLTATGRVGAQAAAGTSVQGVFFCDGTTSHYKYLDLPTNTIVDWAGAVTAGSLPAGSVDATKACRIIVLWRGRIVMAGLQEEPQNWFMSAVDDPFDWDYSPATTVSTQAVAGNTGDPSGIDGGLLGDVVTALMPLNADLLFIGGDHTLWVMRGDPAAGGSIDNITRQVGVVGQEAWTVDTRGNLYFFGNNGLYRLSGDQLEQVSRGKLDRLFSSINTATNIVRLLYDREHQGVHIFITPALAEPDEPTDHYWWDERTDSFWRDQFPTTVGPTAVLLFDADDPDDRAVLLGGWDGYIRCVDRSTYNDDGTAIDSFVKFPLIHPAVPQGQFQLNEVQLALDADGSGAALDIYRGHTPQAAIAETTASFTKALVAGRNVPIRYRLRGNALVFRLRNNTAGQTWAYENGTAMIAGVGRQRAGL